MKIGVTLLLLILSISGFSQENIGNFVSEIYPESRTYVVHGSVIRSLFNSKDSPESLDAIKHIDKIIYSKTPKSDSPIKQFNELSKTLKEMGIEEYVRVSGGSGGFGMQLPEEIQTLTAGSKEVGLYIKDDDGEVVNCVILAKYDNSISVFNILGSFNIGDLSNIDGSRLESLQKALDFGTNINFD